MRELINIKVFLDEENKTMAKIDIPDKDLLEIVDIDDCLKENILRTAQMFQCLISDEVQHLDKQWTSI